MTPSLDTVCRVGGVTHTHSLSLSPALKKRGASNYLMIRSELQYNLLTFHGLNLNIESFVVHTWRLSQNLSIVCVSHFLQTSIPRN